jgi:hypothetical protein
MAKATITPVARLVLPLKEGPKANCILPGARRSLRFALDVINGAAGHCPASSEASPAEEQKAPST